VAGLPPPDPVDERLELGPPGPDGARPFVYDYDEDHCSQYDRTIRLEGLVDPDGALRELRVVHVGEGAVYTPPAALRGRGRA